MKLSTDDIMKQECDRYIDAFYSCLINESNWSILPDSIQEIFQPLKNVSQFDLAFYLDGIENNYFPDHTYFRSEQYENEFYCSIPIGEIEISKETFHLLHDESKDDFTENDGYYYYALPAVTIVYDIDKLKQIVIDFMADNPELF